MPPACPIIRSRGLGLALSGAVLFASPAFAHFPWVFAEKGSVRIFLSETLKHDYGVESDIVAPTTLSFKAMDGATRSLPIRKVNQDYLVDATGNGTIFGKLDLGVMKEGPTPNVLIYFPKAVVGDPFGKDAQVVSAPVELVVVGTPDVPRLKFLVAGKPQPDSEITIVMPNDTQKKVKTDAEGVTEPLVLRGRYGAWARNWLKQPGARDGKAYQEVRRYATIVFDLSDIAKAKAPVSSENVAAVGHLPEATSSFGAAIDAGWLYVYGGHIAPIHDYSKTAVSGAFNRWSVASGKWETLPGGSAVQGMNLAVHAGKIYRVGGMRPENDPGQPSDTRSLSEAMRFDAVAMQWEPLPPLPAPRSSHEVVVVGDKVFVIGGWNMRGHEPSVWADTMQVLDLKAMPLQWQSIPQPFQRRAFIGAVRGHQIFVIGGFDENDIVIDSVDIYDVETHAWSKGPSLPKGSRNGFAPAAATLAGQIYVSLGDGGLYRLNETSASWDKVATTSARIAHRMVPDGTDRLLIVGGAANGDNLDLIETVNLGAKR